MPQVENEYANVVQEDNKIFTKTATYTPVIQRRTSSSYYKKHKDLLERRDILIENIKDDDTVGTFVVNAMPAALIESRPPSTTLTFSCPYMYKDHKRRDALILLVS